MAWKIPLFRIYWDEDDVTAVTEAVTAGMRWAVGPSVTEFETLIADYIGTDFCVVFNSGTSALHAQLLAHGITSGDEVIVPSFTFIATANAPLFVGARPVFADIEEETYGLDPESVKEKITPKTRALIPVHYGGCPCKIRELKEIAEDHDLLLLEDAAEAFGARVDTKKAGSLGDSSMFSFCQNKVITTGDGGAAVTDLKDIYEKLKLIRSHGRQESQDYFASSAYMDYVQIGYNLRMSNITAALGVSQLKKVDQIITMRRKNAQYLSAHLQKIEGIIPPHPPQGYFHVYQMYTIECSRRNELMNYLGERGIMTKVYFSPVHLTQFYKDVLQCRVDLPVTEDMSQRVVSLPIYPHLGKEEMDLLITEIETFYGGVQ
jgi:perosamine synthetase